MSSARTIFRRRWVLALTEKSHPSDGCPRSDLSQTQTETGKVIHARNLTLSILAYTAHALIHFVAVSSFLPSSNATACSTRGQRLRDGNIKGSAELALLLWMLSLLLLRFLLQSLFHSAFGCWMISNIPNASTFNNLFQS